MGEDDLLNVRIINHLFHEEATKRLRKVHNQIVLRTKTRVEELLHWKKNRDDRQLTPFPFTSFDVDISLDLNTLKSFSAAVGPHINRYSIKTEDSWYYRKNTSVQISEKVTILLSHTPHLTELQLESPLDLCVSEQDMLCLPPEFPVLSVIGISSMDHEEEDSYSSPYRLIDIIIDRAKALKELKIPAFRSMILRVLRMLMETRPRNLPCVFFNDPIIVQPDDTYRFLQELRQLRFGFRGVFISFKDYDEDDYLDTIPTEDETLRMYQAVSTWLERQTNDLTHLRIDFCLFDAVLSTFRFPVLKALTNLKIRFPDIQRAANSTNC